MSRNLFEEEKTIDELSAFDRFCVWYLKVTFNHFGMFCLVSWMFAVICLLLSRTIGLPLLIGILTLIAIIHRYSDYKDLWEYVLNSNPGNKESEAMCDSVGEGVRVIASGGPIGLSIDTTSVKTNDDDDDDDDDEENIWDLSRRFYKMHRGRTQKDGEFARICRHYILEFSDLYDDVSETDHLDEANELHDKLYNILEHPCSIIERINTANPNEIRATLISCGSSAEKIFADCDDIINKMETIYDTISADDEDTETEDDEEELKEEKPETPTTVLPNKKPDSDIDNLYSIRNARLFPR